MPIIRIKDAIEKKQGLLGICIGYPAPGVIERIGADWDWIWIDGQHGQHDPLSILSCVRACEIVNRPSVVRVPSHEYGIIGLALDTCACGVMVPMINNARQAESVVKAAKFPPLGERSYGGRRPIDIYGRSYAHTANEDILLIAQIETDEGMDNVEEIASVPGVNAVFFGPDDMSMQSSMPMDRPRNPDIFAKKMERLARAAERSGKIAGTVTPSPESFKSALEMGYKLCIATGDVPILAEGSKNARKLMEDKKL